MGNVIMGNCDTSIIIMPYYSMTILAKHYNITWGLIVTVHML